MSSKMCGNCGELVDEAKVFCPGCGNSFEVEQKRKADSEFELSGGTMQFSKTVLNGMLSEMGLNISESTENDAKQVFLRPSEQVTTGHSEKQEPAKRAKSRKAILIVAAAMLALLIIAAIIAVATFYLV